MQRIFHLVVAEKKNVTDNMTATKKSELFLQVTHINSDVVISHRIGSD